MVHHWFTVKIEFTKVGYIINMRFTEVFTKLISHENVRQTELAKALNVSRQAITNLKNGSSLPSLDVLCAIAKYFDVSTDYLLGLEDEFGNRL